MSSPLILDNVILIVRGLTAELLYAPAIGKSVLLRFEVPVPPLKYCCLFANSVSTPVTVIFDSNASIPFVESPTGSTYNALYSTIIFELFERGVYVYDATVPLEILLKTIIMGVSNEKRCKSKPNWSHHNNDHAPLLNGAITTSLILLFIS